MVLMTKKWISLRRTLLPPHYLCITNRPLYINHSTCCWGTMCWCFMDSCLLLSVVWLLKSCTRQKTYDLKNKKAFSGHNLHWTIRIGRIEANWLIDGTLCVPFFSKDHKKVADESHLIMVYQFSKHLCCRSLFIRGHLLKITLNPLLLWSVKVFVALQGDWLQLAWGYTTTHHWLSSSWNHRF